MIRHAGRGKAISPTSNIGDDSILSTNIDSPIKRSPSSATFNSSPRRSILSSIRRIFFQYVVASSPPQKAKRDESLQSWRSKSTFTDLQLSSHRSGDAAANVFMSEEEIDRVIAPAPSFSPLSWVVDAFSSDAADRKVFNQRGDRNRIHMILRENGDMDEAADETEVIELLLRVRRRAMDRNAMLR
jgi:hypothetical protein